MSTAPFEPRLAVASLSGVADAEWAGNVAATVGCAMLGGLAIDRPTRTAAKALRGRGRAEFLPADLPAFVDRQLSAAGSLDLRPALNVRATELDRLDEVAAQCGRHGAAIELNAHCRQSEMCATGAGEQLMREPDRLYEQVAVASARTTTSVKLRAGVAGVALPELVAGLEAAGASWVHVDVMDSPEVIERLASTDGPALIANNGVRDAASARCYLRRGADAVSVGRASDDPRLLARVAAAISEWFDQKPAVEAGR